jgi:hypothetical protein
MVMLLLFQRAYASIKVLAKTKGKQKWLKQKPKNYSPSGITKPQTSTRSSTNKTNSNKGTATMKKEITTPTKQQIVMGYAISAVKVSLALAFVAAALNLGGYLQLNSIAKEILAAISGLMGIWILISNVR